MNTELLEGIAELLKQTGQAHHTAFAETDGADPDWPIWYAEYARDKFAERFSMDFTKSQLVYCLMRADMEHQARSPDSSWPQFYAHEIVERCAPSSTASADQLALYYFDGCPFCNLVRSRINELGLEIELRNIRENAQHLQDLVDARGRPTVPVLRISSPDGDERWMPESRDIVEYLNQMYA